MSGDLLSNQNFIVKFNKVNWPIFVNSLSYVTRKNSVLFPQTVANVKSEKQRSYQRYVIRWNLSRQELFWWIENISLHNGRKIQQHEPQMTIHTDASTKGW